ncbi:retroviral-like aspartic protease family protein [Paucibacter sp. DJ1R-11]|uniref:aspartyl protease family protein n=1 Tax=Paucibacter sp. DJ1R-11 TaxID=2893556 RepID=UPI0021E388D8|nr:aspartyl protease family protein [Paucibacter sp. DJ1R-11]MCV2365949.1 retroviral-like aspartic protease family protein [Paucibacter sp. DJ1R-11]
MKGTRAVATLGINGQDIPLIVDSGAFYSSLNHAAAQQLKMKVRSLPWGMEVNGIAGRDEHAGVTTAERLSLMGGELPNIDFLVGGNDDHNGTMGLLGRNILSVADTEYDLAHGVVRLMFPNEDCAKSPMAYWAGEAPFSEIELLRNDREKKTPAIETIALINGKRLRVLLDTGARTVMSLKAAKSVGVTDLKPTGRVGGVGQGTVAGWSGAIERFELGGEVVHNVRLSVADFDLREIDMLLGVDFFLSHRIYVSKKQRRMYFTYNGGQVFALSKPEPKPDSTEASANSLPELGSEATAASYARRGAASMARKDFKAALADLDRACEMEPQGADHLVIRAELHQRMRQPQLALKDLNAALAAKPTHAEARLRRAMLRADPGKPEAALQDLEELDRSLPSQAPQRLQMAQVFERLQRLPEVLTQLDHWIAANPHDLALAGTLNQRCWARTLLNSELKRALEDCNRAIDLDSEQGSYHDSRGWLRLRQGEWRKAQADFDRALSLDSKIAWSKYGRGIARSKLGDGNGSQADLEAARKQRPSIDAEAARHGLAAETTEGADARPGSTTP